MTPTETRVLKAHRDAVRARLADAAALMPDVEAAAQLLAEAVLTATDGTKTRYVVGERTPTGAAVIYGPFASYAAAEKAVKLGHLGSHEDSRLGVFPLCPAPKNLARPSSKKKVSHG